MIKHMYKTYTHTSNDDLWNGDFFFALHTNSYSWSTRVFPFIAVLATFTHGTYIISYKSTIYGKKMRFKCVSRDFRSSIKQERTEQRHTTSEVLFTWIKCVFKDCVLVLKWFYSNALQTWNCVKKVLYDLVKLWGKLPSLYRIFIEKQLVTQM